MTMAYLDHEEVLIFACLVAVVLIAIVMIAGILF